MPLKRYSFTSYYSKQLTREVLQDVSDLEMYNLVWQVSDV